MKRSKILGFIVFMLLLCSNVSAQFSISRPTPASSEALKTLADTTRRIRRPDTIQNEFFNKAFWQAEKRRLRKERNTTEFNSTLQMGQTQYENWAGGENTFSAKATLYFMHMHKRKRFSVQSKVDAKYGLNYIEKVRFKNDDQFNINVTSGWDINDSWSYAAAVNLKSQFSTSYKSRDDSTRVSTFMAPGILDLSVGFKYRNKILTVVVSPVGGNAVFVLDKELSDKGINGVPEGRRSKWTVGPSVRADLDWTFYKEIFRLRSTIHSFTNIRNAPTMQWDNIFSIKATKFMTTTINANLYYDREANVPKPRSVQFQYAITVGLAYSFKNK